MKGKSAANGFRFRLLMLRYFRITSISLVLPVLILTAAMLIILVRGTRIEFETDMRAALDKAAVYMDGICQQTQKKGTQAAFDRQITDFYRINRSKGITMMLIDRLSDVFGYLRAMTGANDALGDVLIVAFDPDYYIRTNGASSRPTHVHEGFQDAGIYKLIDMLRDESATSEWRLLEGDMCHYRSISVRNQKVGAILQRLNTVVLKAAVAEIMDTNNRRFIMYDETGEVFFDSLARADDGRGYRTVSRESSVPGMRYALQSDMADLYDDITRIIALGVAFIVLITALCIGMSYSFAKTIIKPYLLILDLLRTPASDAIKEYNDRYAPFDDLGMIHTLINQTKYQNFTMQNELTKRDLALRDAQHIALQAQINPHFIFNSLEAINWRIFEKLPKDRDLTSMIQDLSLLIRQNLEAEEPFVRVRDEIRYAEIYVRIQRRRLDTAFDMFWDMDSSLDDIAILRLSLQPLIENAISHGIKLLDKRGEIRVRGRLENGNLFFAVRDNGPGIDPDTLSRIQKNLVDSRWIRTSSIGLINVNTRIQLFFGVEYGIRIESVPNEYTEVDFVMPARVL